MQHSPLALSPAQKRLSRRHLKVCPLCESLNAAKNAECFVCGWHGDFLRSGSVIEAALEDLIVASPELYAAVQRNLKPPTLTQRLRRWICGPLDLWA